MKAKSKRHRCFRCRKLIVESGLHPFVRWKGNIYWEHLGSCDPADPDEGLIGCTANFEDE